MPLELRKVTHFDEEELSDMLDKKLLRFIIDTKEKELHHVLSSKQHVDEACVYLGIKEEELGRVKPSHIISAQVLIKDKVVKQVIIGGGSLEKTYHEQTGEKFLHTPHQLKKAKRILDKVLKLSEQLHEVTLVEDISKHEFIVPS